MSRQTGLPVTDASIASMSGISQTLLAANPNREYIEIINSGSATVWVNLTGGTAAANTGIPILSNGSWRGDVFVPSNAITVIGTAGQPLSCYWA